MKRQKASFDDFEIEEVEFPGLTPGSMLKEYTFQKLLVRFTQLMPAIPPAPIDAIGPTDGVALQWQGFYQLDADHGMQASYDVLIDANFVALSGEKPTEDIASEIRDRIGAVNWNRVERYLSTFGDKTDKEGHRRCFLIAVWAELFAEPFGELWLAAMAQHAYWVERDEFAFGYLTALLDQKKQNESHFLRGKKGLASAALGGQARAAQSKSGTQTVLMEMERHISAGKSITRAAELTCRAGLGATPEANRKLWYRHRKK